MSVTAAVVLAIVFAVAATVVALVLVAPEGKRQTLGKFGQFLHDTVNFKYLIVEKILKALYIFATAYVILQGFFMLFSVQKSWWGESQWLGGYGFLLMILGPIAVRLAYELVIMAVLLVKNVIEINNKLKAGEGEGKDDLFNKAPAFPKVTITSAAPAAPAAPAVPTAPAPVAPAFCGQCGTRLTEDGTCPNCHR